jgi:aminomethyltransferase
MTVNDPSGLKVGQAQYTAMCYPDGGIVDDLLVYRQEDSYLLVVNASNIAKDLQWLLDHQEDRVAIEDQSGAYALLAVQGPRSQDVLARLTEADLEGLPFYHFLHGRVAGIPTLISRTGYTGEDGFELYISPDHAPGLWSAVQEAGEEYQIEPVGLGARDSLRLEMKYPLYGQDIDRSTNPLEAGLGWITKLDGGDFIGREALLGIKARGLSRKLVGFEMRERAIPRPGYHLLAGGDQIGQVTSGIFSPSLSKGIGTGYVPVEHARVGTELFVLIRNRTVPAEVVKPPFYKEGSRR